METRTPNRRNYLGVEYVRPDGCFLNVPSNLRTAAIVQMFSIPLFVLLLSFLGFFLPPS